MCDLLTREEMLKRLESGEAPLQLAKDKWVRLRDYPDQCKLKTKDFGGRTCALCEIYFPKDCVSCLGICPINCGTIYGYYSDAYSNSDYAAMKERAQDMINLIDEAIKNDND